MLKRATLILLLFELLQYQINSQVPIQDSSQTRSLDGFECSSVLTITKFKNQPGSPNYNYKVVVGQDFEYRATGSSSTHWDWQLGTGTGGPHDPFLSFWPLIAISPVAGSFSSFGTAKIPDSALPGNTLVAGNLDFGSTHGIIQVDDGNPPPLYSTPEKIVEVFYKKDDPNYHDISVPNWFYYWSQINLNTQLSIPGIKFFDISTCSFSSIPSPFTVTQEYHDNIIDGLDYNWVPSGNTNYAGSYNFVKYGNKQGVGGGGPNSCPSLPDQVVMLSYDEILKKIIIGEGAGHYKLDPRDNTTWTTQIRGLYVYLSEIIHETGHLKITSEIWKNGYSSIYDRDKDLYPDAWEDDISQHPGFVFNSAQPADIYTHNYEFRQGVYYVGGTSTLASVGTRYEETTVRALEVAFLNSLASGFDIFDWSYDPTNVDQGKNWKK